MTHRFNLFLVALVCFGFLDAVWLGIVTGTFHRTRHRSVPARMSSDRRAPLWAPALAVYILLAIGIVTLVIPRGGADASLAEGALVGLLVYGAYDLTTLSTLQGWPAVLTTMDIAWGATVSAFITWIVASAHRFLR